MTELNETPLNRRGQPMTPVELLLAELIETYDSDELVSVIATLKRVAESFRDKPADWDGMELSWREFMTQTGVQVPDDFEIPGVTDRIDGALDMPLRELETHIGPHEFRHHLLQFGEQLDRENAELGRALAERYCFPD